MIKYETRTGSATLLCGLEQVVNNHRALAGLQDEECSRRDGPASLRKRRPRSLGSARYIRSPSFYYITFLVIFYLSMED